MSETADPDALDTHAARIIRDAPSLPFDLMAVFCLFCFFARLLTLAYPVCD